MKFSLEQDSLVPAITPCTQGAGLSSKEVVVLHEYRLEQ